MKRTCGDCQACCRFDSRRAMLLWPPFEDRTDWIEMESNMQVEERALHEI